MLESRIAEHATADASHADPEGASAAERQFIEALPLIHRLMDLICRRNYLPGADEDEFRSLAILKIIENDYEVLRRFRGKSSLKTYLLVVLQRVLLDHRVRHWGKWRPSASARRRGPVAVRLEQLIVRDGVSVDEAIDSLRTNAGVTESVATLRAIASELPDRPRLRLEPLGALANAIDCGPLPDAIVELQDAGSETARVRAALRAAVGALPAQDRLILKLRYVDGLMIVDIAQILRLDVRPLYRRIERLLASLREQLGEQGVDRAAARHVIEALGCR